MKETEEIEVINSLLRRSKTLAFDDFEELQRLQDDMDRACEDGLIGENVKFQMILVFLERVERGEADEVAERLYGIKVDRPKRKD